MPHPAIKWYKAGKELDASKYPITHTDGVITIEIINCQPSDSGKYKCTATNSLGSDSTDCVIIVEGTNQIIFLFLSIFSSQGWTPEHILPIKYIFNIYSTFTNLSFSLFISIFMVSFSIYIFFSV